MSGSRKRPGLTVAELLIVIFVLAAIAAVAVPRISRSAELSQENECQRNAGLINATIELYARDNGGQYPADAAAFKTIIMDNLLCFPEGAPVCPMGGTFQYDPVTRRVSCSHLADR